jgi:hypothetical protein
LSLSTVYLFSMSMDSTLDKPIQWKTQLAFQSIFFKTEKKNIFSKDKKIFWTIKHLVK